MNNKKRRVTRLMSFVLICTTLFLIANAGNSWAGSGSISSNNSKIAELNKKAEQIKKANQEREGRISELQKDAAKQKAYMEEVEIQVEQIKAQVAAYIELINAKQVAIDEILTEVNLQNLHIQNIEERILQRESEIERLETENDEKIKKFGQIVAQMYMNDGSDTIGLLTGSKSFYDILVRSEMIKNIGEKSSEITEDLLQAIDKQESAITELKSDIDTLEDEKAVLEEQQAVYESEYAKLEAEKAVVSEEANRQYNALSKLTAEHEELQTSVNSIEREVEVSASELEQIKKETAQLEKENRDIAAFIASQQNSNPDRPNYSNGGFAWPLDSRFKNISCYFGFDPWRNGMHSGIDMASSGINGASIFASQSGTVIRAGWGGGGGYGNYIIIDHGGGMSTLYAHLLDGGISVSVGQAVSQGDAIGKVGSTGFSTGPHLHFEVRVNGTAVNPLNYV